MRRAAILLVLLAASSAAPAAGSDDLSIGARVDRDRIGEGDSVTLTISIEGRAPGLVEEPDLSGLADFTVVAGPNVSTSTSMIWRGGQASSKTTRQYSYTLMPRRRGTLTIPTISVRVGKRIYRTDPIGVEVVEGRLHSTPPPGRRRSTPPLKDRLAHEEMEGEVLVESTADKRSAYVGEQVLVTYRVLTQLELAELPTPQRLPSYTGFWVEEIPVNPRSTLQKILRDGEEFHEFVLMKKVLFPTTSGRLRIESTAFGLPIKVRSRDPFDSIFFTPTRIVYRQTQPLTIHVKPLPDEGRPDSFNGAVGKYTLDVKVDRNEAQVNDAIGLRISIRGTGNIRIIGEPVLPPMPDFKTYEPQVKETRSMSRDHLQGTKVWDYVLTPLAPGTQDIPPIRFAYFDPAEGAYVEEIGPPITVRIARDDGALAGGGTPGRRDVTAIGRDIRYIKPASSLTARTTPYHRSVAFGAMLLAPLLANAALLVFVRRREHLASHADLVRRRRAHRLARRRLRTARKLLETEQAGRFQQEIGRALTGYLGDRLDQAPSGLTHDLIDDLLRRRGVDAELRSDLRRCLESCDYARFAPAEPDPPAMRRMVEDAERLIIGIERQIVRQETGA